MDLQTIIFLLQDGVVNGAIYGLMALALVLLFSVTRVIFIPQGELVALGALTMAALATGHIPGTLWLLVGLSGMALLAEIWRNARGVSVDWKSTLMWCLLAPFFAGALVLISRSGSLALQALATIAVITPMGPLLYRLSYRPLANASVLMLLIVSVALHGVLMGFGLLLFGAEGARTNPFSNASFDIFGVPVSGQSIVIVVATIVIVLSMYLLFERTIIGKAMRATAMNRTGARLIGIPTDMAAELSFAVAALIGAASGLLIAPITTVYYDTGLLIGLKGFVAAIIGALASYPLALAGALVVGLLESFSSYWASAFKEVLVFAMIIPVLWWRSTQSRHVEDDQ
jgi:branched-chain amino acid transport system permease protein